MLLVLFLLFLSSSVRAQNISERSFESACGSVFTQEEFVIESKSYPSNYPESFQCSYLVKGEACPTRFTLQLLDFHLEESLGCSKDRLEVADLDALCGTVSGTKEYFSKSGSLVLRFVSDSERTARGYRILITRSSCISGEGTTTQSSSTVPKWHTTSKDVEYATTTPQPSNSSIKNCCKNNIFQEKQFTLTSPNFPQSMSSQLDCSFEIRKAAGSICRLRFHFHFFYLSGNRNSCEDGYLEIDGKLFCGCQSELKLISAFNSQRKLIQFVSKSSEKRSYTGFVVDVIQDDCPKRLDNNSTTTSEHYDNRVINRVDNSVAIIGKLRLINEKTEIVPDTNRDRDTQIVQHIYYFAEEPQDGGGADGDDREETNYLDTSDSNNNNNFLKDFNNCLNWNRHQFANIQSLTRSTQVCRINTINNNEENTSRRRENCVDLSYVRGYFKSPGYPLYYPGNVNICYRFKMAPGYCSIRLNMKDFNVEESVACRKDYFQLDQQKFCGNRLVNSVLHFDMDKGGFGGGSSYKEMKFVTDSFYCGRGFFGTYEQIACQDMTYPINPAFPHPSTPTPRPQLIPCSRTYQQEVFTIQLMHGAEDHTIMRNSPTTCTFTINKHSPNVCRVRLYFEQFDLFCAYESLVIDGMMYCGHLSGKSVDVDLGNNGGPSSALVLVYRRKTIQIHEQVSESGLVIRGVQISDECLGQGTPPPERLIDPRALKLNSSASASSESKSSLGYLLKIVKHKELCGIITNMTVSELPRTFCEFIIGNGLNNVTECLPLPENALIVPVDSHLIELKIGDVKTIEEIEFSEIDCDDMPSSSKSE